MCLNAPGTMVGEVWQNIPKRHREVELDVFVLMPNHLHGIIRILAPTVPANRRETVAVGADRCVRPNLTEIVRRFKSITTGMCRKNANYKGWPPFERRLWQRNYFERVIRDRDELNHIRAYIDNNPIYWNSDPDNPVATLPLRAHDPWS